MSESLLTRDQAESLAKRALALSKADEARVSITSGWSGNTRFAGNEITTAGGTTDTGLTISSTVGRRRASVTTNVLDDAALARAVETSERIASVLK